MNQQFALDAITLRKHVIDMTVAANCGHIPAALSIVEILIILYNKILNISSENVDDQERDRFVLSKGHGCASLYAILCEKGFFPKSELEIIKTPGGILGGHPEMQKVPGIELSTGSLGHGLPMAIGMAISAKLNKKNYKIICLVGDGESNEGSIWESASIAPHQQLDNLTVIVDFNKFQSTGSVKEILDPQQFHHKWKAFGWNVKEIDGHNFDEINEALSSIPFENGKPSAIIANTIKGKGISFMENQTKWTTGVPNKEEYQAAMLELEINQKEIIEKY